MSVITGRWSTAKFSADVIRLFGPKNKRHRKLFRSPLPFSVTFPSLHALSLLPPCVSMTNRNSYIVTKEGFFYTFPRDILNNRGASVRVTLMDLHPHPTPVWKFYDWYYANLSWLNRKHLQPRGERGRPIMFVSVLSRFESEGGSGIFSTHWALQISSTLSVAKKIYFDARNSNLYCMSLSRVLIGWKVSAVWEQKFIFCCLGTKIYFLLFETSAVWESPILNSNFESKNETKYQSRPLEPAGDSQTAEVSNSRK